MIIKIFGIELIEIEKKTDVLAFAAFVISIGGLITQSVNLLKGSEVLLEPPKQIVFYEYKHSETKKYLAISAMMTYLNMGSSGYNDITKIEEAFIFIGDKTIKLTAQKFTSSSREGEKLIFKKTIDSVPVQIKSGSVVSHETKFFPWSSKEKGSNHIFFSDFLSLLKTYKEINVRIRATTYNGEELETLCKLETSVFRKGLEEKSWSAPVCL